MCIYVLFSLHFPMYVHLQPNDTSFTFIRFIDTFIMTTDCVIKKSFDYVMSDYLVWERKVTIERYVCCVYPPDILVIPIQPVILFQLPSHDEIHFIKRREKGTKSSVFV